MRGPPLFTRILPRLKAWLAPSSHFFRYLNAFLSFDGVQLTDVGHAEHC